MLIGYTRASAETAFERKKLYLVSEDHVLKHDGYCIISTGSYPHLVCYHITDAIVNNENVLHLHTVKGAFMFRLQSWTDASKFVGCSIRRIYVKDFDILGNENRGAPFGYL